MKTIPVDLDCNLLGANRSGWSIGSILGPSRLVEAEGDLVVCEIFLVVDGCFEGFVDCKGLDPFVVFVACSDLIADDVVRGVDGD